MLKHPKYGFVRPYSLRLPNAKTGTFFSVLLSRASVINKNAMFIDALIRVRRNGVVVNTKSEMLVEKGILPDNPVWMLQKVVWSVAGIPLELSAEGDSYGDMISNNLDYDQGSYKYVNHLVAAHIPIVTPFSRPIVIPRFIGLKLSGWFSTSVELFEHLYDRANEYEYEIVNADVVFSGTRSSVDIVDYK